MPPRANLTIQVVETQGREPMVSGGVSLEATANQTVSETFVLPTALHLQGAHINWKGCFPGDRAWVDVLDDQDNLQGGYNLEAGNPGDGRGYWQLVGDNSVTLWNQNSVTAQLPAGWKLKANMATKAQAGTRCMAVNFIMRLPIAE